MGWVFDIMDSALFNFAKAPMLKELLGQAGYEARGAAVEGVIFTVFLIGWALGGALFGYLADRWGRVKTMAVTILIYTLFTGLTALCATWEQVAVVRFITGLGIGGEWAAGAALVAEVFPDRARAAAASFLQSAAAIGPVFASLLNLAEPHFGWRFLFLAGIAPAAVVIVIRIWVRESEKWTAATTQKPKVTELWQKPPLRRNLIVSMLLGAVGIAAAANVSFWLPNFVASVSPGIPASDVQIRTSTATMVLHIGTLLGVFVVPWLCDKWGRRQTLLACMIASPISVLITSRAAHDFSTLLLFAPLMSFTTIGMSAAFVLYFPELFPTRLRATGAGAAYNVARILSAGIPLLTAAVIGSGTDKVGQGIATTALVLGMGVFVLWFAPETKGKPLPD
ncbi:MAG: putative metabolite transport protein YjhB [Fimbriimonadales bacterium]|nr:putative metabolite transport protein YjhB [Fimbriimonadales bacterium]